MKIFWGADRAIIFYNKILLDALVHINDWLQWRDVLQRYIYDHWPEKYDLIRRWLDALETTWMDEYGGDLRKIRNDDESTQKLFDSYTRIYPKMLASANELGVSNEVRELSLILYVHGHR